MSILVGGFRPRSNSCISLCWFFVLFFCFCIVAVITMLLFVLYCARVVFVFFFFDVAASNRYIHTYTVPAASSCMNHMNYSFANGFVLLVWWLKFIVRILLGISYSHRILCAIHGCETSQPYHDSSSASRTQTNQQTTSSLFKRLLLIFF